MIPLPPRMGVTDTLVKLATSPDMKHLWTPWNMVVKFVQIELPHLAGVICHSRKVAFMGALREQVLPSNDKVCHVLSGVYSCQHSVCWWKRWRIKHQSSVLIILVKEAFSMVGCGFALGINKKKLALSDPLLCSHCCYCPNKITVKPWTPTTSGIFRLGTDFLVGPSDIQMTSLAWIVLAFTFKVR